jgi:hypothetical protein
MPLPKQLCGGDCNLTLVVRSDLRRERTSTRLFRRLRLPQRQIASPRRSLRVGNRLSQHLVQPRFCEFLRPRPCRLAPRHNLVSGARTGRRRQRRLPLRHRYDPGFCGWWLVPALQAHAQQFGAHGVATLPYAACDLPGTVAIGPEFSENCNARGIPHALLSYTKSAGADNIATLRVNFACCYW